MKFGKQFLAIAASSMALTGVAQAAVPAQTAVRASATSLPTAKNFRAGPRSGKKRNIFGAAPIVSVFLVAGAVAATAVVASEVAGGSDSN